MIFWIFFFLLLSAFFSGSEIAFISANRLSIDVRREKEPRRGSLLRSFYRRSEDFLASMLIGNNIALVAFSTLNAALLTPMLSQWIDQPFVIFVLLTILTTGVVLLFGEFLPKQIFHRFSSHLLFALAYPLYFFKILLYLPTRLVTGISHWLIKHVFRKDMETIPIAYSRSDLEVYLDESISQENGDVDADMLKRVIHFDKIRVRDCMVPRTEIHYIDVEDSISELILAFAESRKSRLLVVDGDIDEVLGYVHHQKLLTSPKRIKRLIMKMPIVPEAMRINDLLVKFIRERTGIACVVDEFGSTSGIVTMEDILEEIFGEIEDEHDAEELYEVQIDGRTWEFSARLELDYLMDQYEELEFPEGDYHTLSGYIVMTSGSIPNQGEEIRLGDYQFTMIQVSEKKIERVRVEYLPDKEAMQPSD